MIRVVHSEATWECGDGCCINSSCDSIFYHDGKEYEISGYDSEDTVNKFIKDILGIEFDEHFEND